MDYLSERSKLDSTHQRSKRVRSWYMLEQYKTLKRNQLNAALKLKERSLQKRLLRQELSERRTRRQLVGHFGECQSEAQIRRSICNFNDLLPMSLSVDDFCDMEHCADDDATMQPCSDADSNYSHSKIHEPAGDEASVGSADSVVQNIHTYEHIAEETKTELEQIKKVIADNINVHKQLDECKNHIRDNKSEYTASEPECPCETDIDRFNLPQKVCPLKKPQEVNGLFTAWSRIVAFAYNTIQLHHGNCYCNYSSQLLTAVLAFDVLRQGLNRMLDCLQHYVSPIRFAEDNDGEAPCSTRRVLCSNIYCRRKNAEKSNICKRKRKRFKRSCSDVMLPCPTYRLEQRNDPLDGPLQYPQVSSSCTVCPTEVGDSLANPPRTHSNPMIKIANYLDHILIDYED